MPKVKLLASRIIVWAKALPSENRSRGPGPPAVAGSIVT